MMDSDSDDDLQPRDGRGSDFGRSFFSDTDDEPDVRSYDSADASFASSLGSSPRDNTHDDSDDSTTGSEDAPRDNLPSDSWGETGEFEGEVPADLPREELADLGQLPPPRAGRSIADYLIHDKEFCLLSLDLEHGGEYCGIVQLSAEMCRLKLKEPARGCKDSVENWERHTDVFNEYVNPGENALWDDSATAVHGLRRSDPRIEYAQSIHVVWAQFVSWFNELAKEFGAVILVAWNGENCDLKWLWKLCQSPNSPCRFPDKIQFFMDPYKVSARS